MYEEDDIEDLSVTLEFPKTLYALEYLVESEDIPVIYSKFFTFEDENILRQSANESSEFITNADSKLNCRGAIVVPLVLEKLAPQKKSYWFEANSKSKLAWTIAS